MILKALCDYYDRCEGLPPKGMEYKEIGFLLVISKEGRFIRIEDRRKGDGQAQTFLVKQHVGRSSNVAANYLYDNSGYVFGYPDKPKVLQQFQAFKDKVESIYEAHPYNSSIIALHKFYQQEQPDILKQLQSDSLWPEIMNNLNTKFSFFSFLIEGETKILAEKEELFEDNAEETTEEERICLVSGEKGAVVKTTTATMIPGSQATARLVAFQVNSGYDSYGKRQGGNAPISADSEFAYTTALNHMLGRDSRNKFTLDSRTYLFWASQNNEVGRKAEDCFFDLFGFDEQKDDPNRGVERVRKVFEAIYSGEIVTTSDDKFFILGLAPNSARIAVTYWAEIPICEFAERICKHINDMAIVDTRKEKRPYISLRNMLSAVSLGGKASKAPPKLADAVVRSIFEGVPYPRTLFESCIRRIRAESSNKGKSVVHLTRAAIIKAYLNRQNKNQEIKIMLDKESTNQGYLCGRLFAVLDRIQEEANDLHSIRERYMNSASSTPAAVFPTILRLSSHHSNNLKSESHKIFFEKMKQEIISKIEAEGFKAHLDLQDQGRFFIGFYHQRQDFFTPKEDNEQ